MEMTAEQQEVEHGEHDSRPDEAMVAGSLRAGMVCGGGGGGSWICDYFGGNIESFN